MSQLLNESDDLQDLILLKTVCEQYKEHLKFIRLLMAAKEKNLLMAPSTCVTSTSAIDMQCEAEKKILMHLIDSDRKLSKEEAAEIKTTLVSFL